MNMTMNDKVKEIETLTGANSRFSYDARWIAFDRRKSFSYDSHVGTRHEHLTWMIERIKRGQP